MNIKLSQATSFLLVLLVVDDLLINSITATMSSRDIEIQIDMGNRLLAAGQLADALTHFHTAIDGDPNNYMSFFKRGTVYLAMGKFKSALQDLNRVIELKPDFTSARMQRANVLTKQGLFQEAIQDYTTILSTNNQNMEAKSRMDTLFTVMNDLDTAKRMMDGQDYGHAIDIYTKVLELCPWSTEIHELRSECFLNVGDLSKAILDINALAKLIPDNTKAYLKLSQLYYTLGDVEYSLNSIRECLRLDPDIKDCSDVYKKVRKLNKLFERTRKAIEEQNYDECVTAAKLIVESDSQAQAIVLKGRSFVCTCSSKSKDTKLAIEACSELISKSPNDVEALFNRAEAYIAEEQLEAAQKDCQRANEIENSQRAMECLDRINKLIRQAKKKDYYKILGVKRNADKKSIMKAYRKLAHKWHPDKFSDGPEKDEAQKKFIDIAAAKEVLTDPEKRAKFDNGEDPLDPEEQAQRGFNPFGHGFNPFGGGGHGGHGGNFQFKFKFG